jgi:archaellin
MKNKKLTLFIIITISILFILSGCSNGGILLKLSPNPVEFSQEQTERNLEITIKTEGLGSITLDKMIIEVLDEKDETIFRYSEDLNISDQFIVGGFSESVNYTLDLENIFSPEDYGSYDSFSDFYIDILQGKRHTLRITVTGSDNSSLTTKIIYN